MPNRSLIRNAGMAVIQAVVSGGVIFLLYRYLLAEIGPEQVGIWSIVLATVSASKISEMGFTGSAVKFTAQYLARDEADKACEVIITTLMTIGVVLAGVLAIAYPVIAWMLPKFIPAGHLKSATDILPHALVSVWIGAVAGVYLSGLEGCQRVDLRAWMTMLATLLFLVFTLVLVPRHGLKGLAWAQIGQGALMLAGGRMLLQRVLPEMRLPRRWDYPVFREMFRYGVNFQITSIFAMLVEPTTKALLAKFGGLSQTAYYEMASRMVTQFRSLLVAANRVVIPRIADLHEREPQSVQVKYLESYRVIFFLALPLYSGIASAAPLISGLWIGHHEPSFVIYTLLIAAGNWVNTLVGPAYFVNLGTGMLQWNTTAHVFIAIVNALLGYLLGVLLGGDGVVIGNIVALVTGSSLIVFGYHRDHHISMGELLPHESNKLLLACCAGLLIGLVSFHMIQAPATPLARAGLCLALTTLTVAPVVWLHPARTRLAQKVIGAS